MQIKDNMKVRQGNEYKYYNFKFEEKKNTQILTNNTLFLSKKDGKYGYVNKDGVVVVNYIYDDATEQNDSGYAAIKKDGKWGAIDENGNIVVEPSLTLDNNTVINFMELGIYQKIQMLDIISKCKQKEKNGNKNKISIYIFYIPICSK